MDDEIAHILAGWAAVFIGSAAAILAYVLGSVVISLLWSLLVSAGILVLVYAFVRWRVPEIIQFVKKREWENEWTRSLGL